MRSAAGSKPRPRAREALSAAAARLAAAGSQTPRLDAEVLLAHVLDVDRPRLLLDAGRELAPAELDRFDAAVRRREAREPVAYIVGRRAFRRIELHVDRRVLVPRPETELLVEAALDLPRGARVLDVGTGSGAVALALKDERPDLEVTGTDSSEDALAVARGNAERLELAVSFVHGDLLAGVTEVDSVLSNPPYVAAGDDLPPDVADHEPAAALYAGADGLDVIRRLLPAAAAAGASFVAVEVGRGQAPAVAELARGAGFAVTEPLRDLAGIDRVVVGRAAKPAERRR